MLFSAISINVTRALGKGIPMVISGGGKVVVGNTQRGEGEWGKGGRGEGDLFN